MIRNERRKKNMKNRARNENVKEDRSTRKE